MNWYREIEFEIPYHIRAPDGFESSNAQFYPRVSGYPIELSFQTRTSGQLDIGGLATVRRNRFGNVVRSGVRAKFHPRLEEAVPNNLPDRGIYPSGTWLGDRDGFYIKLAVRALNRFIEIYREETGSYWLRALEPGDIGEFEIQDFEGGELEKSTERTVTPGGTVLGGMSENDLQKIEKRLESGSQTNIYQTLHLDVRESIDQREYAVAVILAYELFERWIKNAFVEVVSSSEKSRHEAEALIKRDDGRYVKLSTLLQSQLDHHTNLDFQNASVFGEWDEKLRCERNKVVHEDYNPDWEAADEAHRTVLGTIEWFQKQFSPALDNTDENIDFVDMREIDAEGT